MTGWPWPLDAVQSFFESMWRGLVDAISSASQWLYQKVHDGLSWLWSQIQSGLNWIWERLSEFGQWLWGQIQSGINWIWERLREVGAAILNAITGGLPMIGQAIQDLISIILSPIKASIDWLLEQIQSGLNWIASKITEGVGWLWERITEGLGSLGSQIGSGLQWLADMVSRGATELASLVGAGLASLGSQLQTGIAALSGQVQESVGWLGGQIHQSSSWLYNEIVKYADGAINTLFQNMLNLIDPFWRASSHVLLETWQQITQGIIESVIGRSVGSIYANLGISSVVGMTSSKQDPFTAYSLQNQIIEQTRAAWYAQAVANISAELASLGQIDINLQTLMNNPDLQVLLDAYRQIHSIAMDAQLYQPLRLAYNYAYQPRLPSPDDMIRFMVREAYYPEKQVEMPGQFIDWMKFLGYSEEWTRLFWGAHWQLPSMTQVFTMLHRKLITPEHVDAYLRLADIEPAWRPLLRAISYELPDRIRTRWMYEWGLIDLQTWRTLDELSGLDPQWSGLMVQAELRNILRDDITAVRSELHRQAREGLISLAEYETYLRRLGLPEPVIALRVDAARLARDTDARLEILKALRQAYVDKKLDDAQYAESLARLGVAPDAMTVFSYVDRIKREPKPIPPETIEKRIADLQDRIRKYELAFSQAQDDLNAMQTQMAEELQAIQAELDKRLADIDDKIRVMQARWQFAKNDREIGILRVEIENLLSEKAQLSLLYAERYDAAKARWDMRIAQQQQKIREIELELAILRERLSRLTARTTTPA